MLVCVCVSVCAGVCVCLYDQPFDSLPKIHLGCRKKK